MQIVNTYWALSLNPCSYFAVYRLFFLVFKPIAAISRTHSSRQHARKPGWSVMHCIWFSSGKSASFSPQRSISPQQKHSSGLVTSSKEQHEHVHLEPDEIVSNKSTNNSKYWLQDKATASFCDIPCTKFNVAFETILQHYLFFFFFFDFSLILGLFCLRCNGFEVFITVGKWTILWRITFSWFWEWYWWFRSWNTVR